VLAHPALDLDCGQENLFSTQALALQSMSVSDPIRPQLVYGASFVRSGLNYSLAERRRISRLIETPTSTAIHQTFEASSCGT
jgi:hypothetical protein